MDREQLKNIPQLEDEQLLYQLVQKDDNFGGQSIDRESHSIRIEGFHR